jgi:hypothetical protein
MVFDYANRRKIPLAATLAGGYAMRVEDTVQIHVGTILAARDLLQRSAARSAQ